MNTYLLQILRSFYMDGSEFFGKRIYQQMFLFSQNILMPVHCCSCSSTELDMMFFYVPIYSLHMFCLIKELYHYSIFLLTYTAHSYFCHIVRILIFRWEIQEKDTFSCFLIKWKLYQLFEYLEIFFIFLLYKSWSLFNYRFYWYLLDF